MSELLKGKISELIDFHSICFILSLIVILNDLHIFHEDEFAIDFFLGRIVFGKGCFVRLKLTLSLDLLEN